MDRFRTRFARRYLGNPSSTDTTSRDKVYKPLKQTSRFYRSVKQKKTNFRLLILHAGEDRDERIQCSLRHASIEEETHFTALSYTWGDASATRYILLDGKSFLVTKNLHIALQYLRSTETDLTLWIDAICVNQEDMHERSHQVQIMRQIYEKAEDTWIWLGPEADSSDKAFDLLNLLALVSQDHRKRMEEQKKQASLLAPLAKWNVEEGIVAIGALLKRPWWFRVWVIQELALSKRPTVHCGRRSLPWVTVSEGIEYLAHQQLLSIAPMMSGDDYVAGFLRVLNISYLRAEAMRGLMKPSLLYVLSQHRRSEASDPRDKCIALAGLAEGADFMSRMEPYNESIAAIYTETVKAIATGNEESPLDFLMCSGRPRRRNELPSWVPDWSYAGPQNATLLMHQLYSARDGYGETPLFNCTQSFGKLQNQPCFSFPEGYPGMPQQLAAKGSFFDAIDGLGVPWNSQEDDLEETFLGRPDTDLWTLIQPTGKQSQYPGHSKLQEALWRTLLIDRTKKLPSESVPAHFGTILANLLLEPKGNVDSREITDWFNKNKTFAICGQTVESILRQILGSQPTGGRYSKADTEHVKIVFNTATSFRRLVTTEGGYVCLVPLDALRGDIIALLYGCSVPVVLRKSEGFYEFVGGCYVHDIMNGEFAAQREGDSGEVFVIR